MIGSNSTTSYYPRSLNISLPLIISDFTRRRQSLIKVWPNQGVCKQNNTKHGPELSSISSLAKCKVREKTTPRQFVKNKVRETLSDLGSIKILGSTGRER